LKIGVIADDFTGGSDIALTLFERGMRVVEYVGVPTFAAEEKIDAGVVALKIRTEPAEFAVKEALAACEWLLAQGCMQIVYKVCSTFDSTAAGNIGPVSQALAHRLGEEVVVVCPAFPENGRSVYQGHLFVADRLLSESGMEHHPLTPMTDPDLRRVLSAQTSWTVGHVPFETVARGRGAIAATIESAGRAMLIVDAIRDQDLVEIGRAVEKRTLVVGGSGIALGLKHDAHSGDAPEWNGENGPGVVLSGSCSVATRGQVAAYRQKAPSRELQINEIMTDRYSVEELCDWVLAQEAPPIIYSSADPKVVASAQEKYGREASAAAVETLFSSLAAALAQRGVTRIVVAGGETSGAVVSGLGAVALKIGPRIAAGVPATRMEGKDLALALKSGNFGGPDFFAEALTVLGGHDE
jgi:3-dehydrotetronate 4-kinase